METTASPARRTEAATRAAAARHASDGMLQGSSSRPRHSSPVGDTAAADDASLVDDADASAGVSGRMPADR